MKPPSTGDGARPPIGDTVSALERGVAVLRAFGDDRRVLSATALSQITGVPRPTVTRLALTLVSLGLVKQAPDGERFMLGAGVVPLAHAFLAGLDVREVARPRMQALADAVGASVELAVRDGLEMVLVEVCRPRSSILAVRFAVGSRAPLATSAPGRAFLHALAPAQRRSLVDALRHARGTEWHALAPGLARALADGEAHGYCLSLGEFHREINAVAVPLRGAGGEAMALNCEGAAFTCGERRLRDEIAPQLLALAHALSPEVGGDAPALPAPSLYPPGAID